MEDRTRLSLADVEMTMSPQDRLYLPDALGRTSCEPPTAKMLTNLARSIGEFASFLGAGVVALIRIWRPDPHREAELILEPEPGPEPGDEADAMASCGAGDSADEIMIP